MVTTWYGEDSPHLLLPKPAVNGGSGECARVTGKAGENSHYSGAGRDQGNLALGSLSTGSPASRALLLFKRRDGSMYRQAHVRAKVMEKPCLLERSRP